VEDSSNPGIGSINPKVGTSGGNKKLTSQMNYSNLSPSDTMLQKSLLSLMIEDHKLSTKEIEILESKIFIPHLISNSTII
jgi:hypothetical protein